MNPKILVIGSKGMLGQDLMEELVRCGFSSIGWDIQEIDITKSTEMKKIENEKIDVLVNCAAYTNVDMAEMDRERCYQINVIGIKNIVSVCKKEGIILVSLSTDYVFNGSKYAYDEEDKKDPINYYGKTKAEGEDLITSYLQKYYIVRTSWLFGKNGRNFVDTIIKLCSEKKEIRVVNDQIGKPTYTKDLCKGIIQLITHKKPFGIYHISNSGQCTWFEFAKKVLEFRSSECIILPCTTDEFPREAKRPKYSILNNNKTAQLRIWQEALKDYLEE